MNLKRNKGEGKKLVEKKTNKNTSPQIPPTSGINLEDHVMDKFCCAHYENHLEKNCPEFVNLFKAMVLPRENLEEDKEEEKEEVEKEEEVEPSSNLYLIWDDTELDDTDDDIMEEACVGNDYNIWSKGAPKINDFPSTSKMGSLGHTKDMRRNPTIAQPTTSMELT